MRSVPNRPLATSHASSSGEKRRVSRILERLLESGRDQETASRRQPAHEQLEHRGLGLAALEIGLQHVELVEIGEQRIPRRIHVITFARLAVPPQPNSRNPACLTSG